MPFPRRCNRRYLTGTDWLIGTLNAMTRQATGAGNSSQIVLELEGRLDAQRFAEVARAFAAKLPALSGRPARDGLNLAPFWKMDRPAGQCLVETLEDAPDRQAALGQLARAVNTPWRTERDHLAFRLVSVKSERTLLGMTFDHRLFDARGAELFLDRLAAFSEEETPLAPEIVRPVRGPHLDDWRGRFAAGRNVNRALRACAQASPASFPLPPFSQKPGFRFHCAHLEASQSVTLTEAAYAHGGYLVKMPYLLALAVQGVEAVFRARGQAPEHYLIPVTIDRRAARADTQGLFFNHISFLHFLAARGETASLQTLTQSLVRQMYEQTKSRLPEDFERVLFLTRILPVGMLAALSRRIFGSKGGTFAFSYLGESGCRARRLLGRRILNLFHTPRVATPPGLGVFVNEFDGRINLTAAHLEGLLSEEEGAGLLRPFLSPS